MSHRRGLVAALLPLLVQGCAGLPEESASLPVDAASIELDGTPFYPQERFQCGPAALATVLDASGIEVELAALVDRVYLPGRRGSLKVELLAAARTSGRVAYVIPPALDALYAELEAGRPVLVLQNLGIAALPRWHYAVVVGVDAREREVVLRSGVDRRRTTALITFLRTWQRSDFWGMVVLEPGELPATPERQTYLEAAAAFENAGEPGQVLLAWQAAADTWPDSEAARFGVANALYAADDLDAAVVRYRELLDSNPELAAVRNNLAMALAGLGRFDTALDEVDRAKADAGSLQITRELEATRIAIVEAMNREHLPAPTESEDSH